MHARVKGNLGPQNKKKGRGKSVPRFLRRENRAERTWTGSWGSRGVDFPDRVVRGRVKFVLSLSTGPASQRRCAFHRHFITFSNGDSLPQLDAVASCCCKTRRTGPAWLNESCRRPPVTLTLPHPSRSAFRPRRQYAYVVSVSLLPFCLHSSSTATHDSPTAFRNTSEKEKRTEQPPYQLLLASCGHAGCTHGARASATDEKPITGHNYSISISNRYSTVLRNHFVALGSLTPVWIYFFIPSPLQENKCYVLLSSQMRCKVDHALRVGIVFGQGGPNPLLNLGFFHWPARVTVETTNQPSEEAHDAHTLGTNNQ